MTQKPPQLKNISQCSKILDFAPFSSWPMGLPAVAVNGFVLAGFSQSLVFDHQVEELDGEVIASLFRSFYFDLSAVELSKLANRVKTVDLPWFPLELVFAKFQMRWNDQTEKLTQVISELPVALQKFTSDKKWSLGDFSPLLSAQTLSLEPLFFAWIERNLSRSLAVQSLELFVELRLMGIDEALTLPQNQEDSDLWLKRLRALRYPQSSQAESEAALQIKDLPWPGSSKARWVRQGDKTGIELKLFVSNPSDLKKYVQSLVLIQEAMEQADNQHPWKKH